MNSGIGDGQGGLACCDSWGHKESDTTERLHFLLVVFVTNPLPGSGATNDILEPMQC